MLEDENHSDMTFSCLLVLHAAFSTPDLVLLQDYVEFCFDNAILAPNFFMNRDFIILIFVSE